jgi:hypothetical protein
MERLDIIEALKHLPDSIELEISGLPDAALRQRASEGEWSVKEVIGHLLDHTAITQKRLYMVWSMTDPVLPAYDGDALVREKSYQDADVRALIKDMRRIRLESVDLLAHAVDWTRLGQLPGVGRRSLRQLAERALDHETTHVEQIRQLKALTGAPAPG